MASKVVEKLFNINNVQSGKKAYKTCPKFQELVNLTGISNKVMRNVPCTLTLPVLQLPDKLDRAAVKYLRDRVLTRPRDLRIQAIGLKNALWSRVLLIEKNMAQHLRKKIEQSTILTPEVLMSPEMLDKVGESADIDLEELIMANASSILNMQKADVNKMVKREMQEMDVPIRYSKHLSDLYLVSRLSANFASCCKVLYEIRKRCPSFNPVNLFDFGSGVGSAVWAANSVWPIGTIQQHYLVDASTNMLAISEYLLKDGAINQHLTALPGITHRSFLPASHDVQYDLVISCYSLLDVTGGYLNRRSILTNLWRKTNGFLVLIELGTKAGFEAILEARNWLIESTKLDDQPACIFAPCTHAFDCPKAELICNFTVKYEAMRLTQPFSTVDRETFSYLILHKGDISQYRDPDDIDVSSYPRIVSYKTDGFVQDLCASDGTVTRYHMQTDDKPLKKFLRSCRPGDLMPVVPLSEDNENVDE